MENSTKIITIAKVEMTAYESGNQYKVTATDGLKFKFYDKKKDGNSTVAFTQFQDMGLKIGSTCEVWFKEQDKEYQGKPYTDRIIASFREAKSAPTQTPTQATKNAPRANLSEPAYVEPKSEAFWNERGRRLALHGFINARLVNNPISQVEQEIDQLLKLEDKIDAKLLPSTPQAPQVVVSGVDESDMPLPEIPF